MEEELRVFGRVLDGNGLKGRIDGPLGHAITDSRDNGGKNGEKQNDPDQCPSFHVLSFPSPNPGFLTARASQRRLSGAIFVLNY
jgi:hypothetical protein